MSLFELTWEYLTTAASWTGDGGLLDRLVEQLLLTVTALALGVVIGLPLALWLGHIGRGGFLAINISNIGRAIPTFALLAVLVTADWPGPAQFGPYGRAGLATLIALALFALPPLVTNAYTAIREVPADVLEAADGMGMSGIQRFWRVELPLALPLMMSGVRLALVQVWATATIAALVAGPASARSSCPGSPATTTARASARRWSWRPRRWSSSWSLLPRNGRSSLAEQGHRRKPDRRCPQLRLWCPEASTTPGGTLRRPDTRGTGRGTQKVEPMTLRRTLLAAVVSGGLLITAGCAGDDVAEDDADNDDGVRGGGNVTLASQSFDEAALVTAMYAEILDDLGYEVETKLVDTRPAYLAEFPGSVDIVPEYVAGLGDQLNTDANGEDAAADQQQ